MRMLTGEDHCPGRCADGVGDTGVGKQHTALGNAVNIGGAYQAGVVRRNGLIGMVVGHDEHDIGAFGGFFFCSGPAGGED